MAGLLVSVLLFVCCSETDKSDPDKGGDENTPTLQLTATFEPMTDADGDQGGKLKWTPSDRIKAFVVPAESQEQKDWGSFDHCFVTDGEHCSENVFFSKESFQLDADPSYDWYAMSPYDDRVLDPVGGNNSMTCFPLDGQVMDIDHPEAHIASFDIMTAVQKNIPASGHPEFRMEHKCMLMKFTLVNQGSNTLSIQGIEVKSPSEVCLSGVYSIDFNPGAALIPVVKKNSAVLDFSYECVLKPGESQDACLVLPPFAMQAGQLLVVETKTADGVLENSILMDQDMDFKAGTMQSYTLELQSPELVIPVGDTSLRMVRVAGGVFMMGASSDQPDAEEDEKPAHQVSLSDYYIGRYEVTQKLWETVMGSNPSEHRGSSSYPVENVSWEDIVSGFLPKLNEMTGLEFSLPTEAQWEFAARGGIHSEGYQYSGSDEVNEVCWFEDNSNGQTQPVGTKLPNELGLYDMSGNVWEWCQDWYSSYTDKDQIDPTGPAQGQARILRGASYNYAAWNCRVVFRSINYPDYEMPFYGFRLVLN